MQRFAWVFLLFFLVGCTIQPTKVVETQKREFVQVVEKTQKPIEIGDFTIVLDARSSFDFGLNRIQGSRHFRWQDIAEDERRGEIIRDKHQAMIRLSLKGLTPTTPVVVVGYGRAGQGEEGRLAWTLLYLGFQDVQVSGIEAFRKIMTPQPPEPARNEPLWKPQIREELQISKDDFQKLDPNAILLDVRSPKEYLEGAPSTYKTINIEWKEFYSEQGRPELRFKKKLMAIGVKPEDNIIVVSNRGVRSAAAAYALLAMGYPRVRNFTGGWLALGR